MPVTRAEALAILADAVGHPSSGRVAEALAILAEPDTDTRETRVTKATETR